MACLIESEVVSGVGSRVQCAASRKKQSHASSPVAADAAVPVHRLGREPDATPTVPPPGSLVRVDSETSELLPEPGDRRFGLLGSLALLLGSLALLLGS
ncbi:MAG: hypothetical protein IV100_04660, partial [Myxococcales bacterium]|nr:hypothetical protein [Myxococcales bacterium]